MFIAISTFRLFSLISLGLIFFFGLGWLVVGPILHGSFKNKGNNLLFQGFPLIFIVGIMINYGIILCFQSIGFSLLIGMFLSIIGVFNFSIFFFKTQNPKKTSLISLVKFIGISIVCLIFLSPIITEPLSGWDARSIWFFHSKMIYSAGTIGQFAGWEDSSLVFSHPDYPNLIPSIGAQVAYLMGFWNEYIPKISLIFLLVPSIWWVFTFARRTITFSFLLFLIPFSFSSQLWNGYMDGYFAFYFSIAMLLLGRYINLSQSIDLISSFCCLIILLYIKNEGALAVIIGLLLYFFIYVLKKKKKITTNVIFVNWKYYIAIGLLLLPYILWTLYKYQWDLSNDLGLGTIQSFLNIIQRLTDGSVILIFQSIFNQLKGSLILLILLVFALFAWKKSIPIPSLIALIAALFYLIGMVIIYLLSPFGLEWHLKTSIDRTMLSVSGCIIIGCYYILKKIEDNESANFGFFYNEESLKKTGKETKTNIFWGNMYFTIRK